MTLDIEHEQIFKEYVIKKLEAISDADSEVLAEYVVALVKSDDSKAVTTALEDFIPDSAQTFVDEIFGAIASKTYDPNAAASKGTTSVFPTTTLADSKRTKLPAASRKRSYYDRDAEQNGQRSVFEADRRPPKRANPDVRPTNTSTPKVTQQSYGSSFNQAHAGVQLPPPPTPPPGMPPFDFSNPMASFMAMQQSMTMLLGMPTHGVYDPLGSSNDAFSSRQCHDYNTKGFCTRGTSCPYEHGENLVLVRVHNDEYNPEQPSMLETVPSKTNHPRRTRISSTSPRSKRGNHQGRHRKRASFSMEGLARSNRSNTSIIVEQIPKDYLNELAVRDFFSQFGEIEFIDFTYHRALAVVTYIDHASARAAYESPKCIFENRFVKVYWHRPDKMTSSTRDHAAAVQSDDVSMASDEPAIDLEEVARLQEEAQKRHDAAKKRRIEVLEQRRQLDEKLTKINWERQRTIELLAKKSRKSAFGDDNEQTTVLKARLAELQSEAKDLGIDMDGASMSNGHDSPPPVRGGFTGRSRGRGYTAGHRGRGGIRSVMSLDNRPKTVAITFADSTYQDREEGLRQYLMFNGLEDSASLTQHPVNGDAALIRFQQRYEGENFLAAASYAGPLAHSDLPKVLGKVKLEWYRPGSSSNARLNDVEESETTSIHADGGAQNGFHADSKEDPPCREDRDMDTYDEGDEVY